MFLNSEGVLLHYSEFCYTSICYCKIFLHDGIWYFIGEEQYFHYIKKTLLYKMRVACNMGAEAVQKTPMVHQGCNKVISRQITVHQSPPFLPHFSQWSTSVVLNKTEYDNNMLSTFSQHVKFRWRKICITSLHVWSSWNTSVMVTTITSRSYMYC
jgi:hypothetical protein